MAAHFPKSSLKRIALVAKYKNPKRRGVRSEDVVTSKDLAKKWGVSKDMIDDLYRIYNAHQDVLAALTNKTISYSQAVVLSTIHDQETQLEFLNLTLTRSESTSVRELKKHIKNRDPTGLSHRTTVIETGPEILRILEMLEEKLGTHLKIKHNPTKQLSTLIIGWTGHDNMLELLDKLTLKDSEVNISMYYHAYDKSANMPYGTIRAEFTSRKQYEDIIVQIAMKQIPHML